MGICASKKEKGIRVNRMKVNAQKNSQNEKYGENDLKVHLQ